MINNRYVELGYCKTPIISFRYPNIDWFGAEDFINFIESSSEFFTLVDQSIKKDKNILKKTEGMKKFIDNQHKIYFEKLDNLLGS